MGKLPTRKLKGASTKKKKVAPKAEAPSRKPGRASKHESGVSLPQKDSEPPKKLQDYTIFLYGKKGVGKTSMAAQFPGTTVFQWEPRRRNIKCRQVPKSGEEPLTWERFKLYADMLCNKPTRVATDTIDRAWKCCVKYMLGEWNVRKPNDLPGNDRFSFWAEAKIELADVYESLLLAGCDLLFTSHYKKVTINPRDGDAFDEWEPGCGAAWDLMKDVCDTVLFYYYRRGERSITVRGTELLYASPGPEGHFIDPDGNPLIEFPVSSRTAKEAYKDLLDAYNNKLYGFVEEEEGGEGEEDEEEEEE